MILCYCNWSICFSFSGLLPWSMIPGQQEVVSWDADLYSCGDVAGMGQQASFSARSSD